MSQSDLLDQARLDVVEAARACLPNSKRVFYSKDCRGDFREGFAMVPLGAWVGLLDALLEERRHTAAYLHDSGHPHDSDHCGRCQAEKKETDT